MDNKVVYCLLIVVAVMIVTGVLSYNVGKRIANNVAQIIPPVTVLPKSTLIPTQSPSVALLAEFKPPANWKTHSNKIYNYSISYPPDGEFNVDDKYARVKYENEQLTINILANGAAKDRLLSELEIDEVYGKSRRDVVNSVLVFRYKRDSMLNTRTVLPKPIPPTKEPWFLNIFGVAKDSQGEELYNQIVSTFKYN